MSAIGQASFANWGTVEGVPPAKRAGSYLEAELPEAYLFYIVAGAASGTLPATEACLGVVAMRAYYTLWLA